MDADELTPEERSTLSAIQQQKKKLAVVHRLKKGAANNQALLPRRADAQRLSTTTNLKVGRPLPLHWANLAFSSTLRCQQPKPWLR